MHPSTFLTLPILVLTSLTLASPLPASTASTSTLLTESKPWTLKNLTIFSASNISLNASSISFTFVDASPQLKLVTTCSRTIPTSSSDSSSNASTPAADPLADATTWYPCANSTVGFQYQGGGKPMKIQRSYIDNSVGEAPWNVVTAFGVSGKDIAGGKGQAGKGKVKEDKWGRTVTVQGLKVKVNNVIA